MYKIEFWTLWEKARVGCFERTASKHEYYPGCNRSPAQLGCMRQVLGPGALGRPRGIGWRGRWEGGSGWGIHVSPWLIHVNVWQKPLQYCKVISLQLIKINGKKKNNETNKQEAFLEFLTFISGEETSIVLLLFLESQTIWKKNLSVFYFSTSHHSSIHWSLASAVMLHLGKWTADPHIALTIS